MARFSAAFRSAAALRAASPAPTVALRNAASQSLVRWAHPPPCRARAIAAAAASTSKAQVPHVDAAAAAVAVVPSDDSTPTPQKTTKKSTNKKPPPPLPPLVPRGSEPPDGDWGSAAAYLIDKPRGWSSHDACAKLRGALRFATRDRKIKVGHAGTLDPLATGLLIVCVGKGTKAVDRFVAMEKEYTGTLRLGLATPSLDAETADLVDDDSEDADSSSSSSSSSTSSSSLERAVRFPWEHVTDSDLERAAQSLTGDGLLQSPPMFSAVSVGGERLYRAARRGEEVERPRREISVTAFEVRRRERRYDEREEEGEEGGEAFSSSSESSPSSSSSSSSPSTSSSSSSSSPSPPSPPCPDVDFRVECSKGTYVRVLAADLGTAAGTAAHLVALRRTRIGADAGVGDAWPLLELVAAVRRQREEEEEEEAKKEKEGGEALPRSAQQRTPTRAFEKL